MICGEAPEDSSLSCLSDDLATIFGKCRWLYWLSFNSHICDIVCRQKQVVQIAFFFFTRVWQRWCVLLWVLVLEKVDPALDGICYCLRDLSCQGCSHLVLLLYFNYVAHLFLMSFFIALLLRTFHWTQACSPFKCLLVPTNISWLRDFWVTKFLVLQHLPSVGHH